MNDKKMQEDLDMASHKIKNLLTPLTKENSAATNVAFVSEELRKLNLQITLQLTDDMKQYVNESHITSSSNKKKMYLIISWMM